MNEWKNEWMNEKHGMIEWMNACMNEWMHEWMNGWMNGLNEMKWNAWMYEMNEWNEWMNGSLNMCFCQWARCRDASSRISLSCSSRIHCCIAGVKVKSSFRGLPSWLMESFSRISLVVSWHCSWHMKSTHSLQASEYETEEFDLKNLSAYEKHCSTWWDICMTHESKTLLRLASNYANEEFRLENRSIDQSKSFFASSSAIGASSIGSTCDCCCPGGNALHESEPVEANNHFVWSLSFLSSEE